MVVSAACDEEYGSEQPTPSTSPRCPLHVPQIPLLTVPKVCLSQDWPSCSKRPFLRRYIAWAIRGCWLVPCTHSTSDVPMLHDVVPTEYAVMPPTAPQRVMLVRSPTMTSGFGGGSGSV